MPLVLSVLNDRIVDSEIKVGCVIVRLIAGHGVDYLVFFAIGPAAVEAFGTPGLAGSIW